MAAIYCHLEPADEPGFVSLRTSAKPNSERYPAMIVREDELHGVMLMLLDAANRAGDA
jgi:hypothetical protein